MKTLFITLWFLGTFSWKLPKTKRLRRINEGLKYLWAIIIPQLFFSTFYQFSVISLCQSPCMSIHCQPLLLSSSSAESLNNYWSSASSPWGAPCEESRLLLMYHPMSGGNIKCHSGGSKRLWLEVNLRSVSKLIVIESNGQLVSQFHQRQPVHGWS